MIVNNCSATGCRSRSGYVKGTVKLHRFPLMNAETLSLWVAATEKDKDWKPCKSSRLCSDHFRQSDYKFEHGKGVLKPTAIPKIKYSVKIPRYNKIKIQHSYDCAGNTNKPYIVEPMENNSNDKIEYEINCCNKINDKNGNKKEESIRVDERKIDRENQCYMFTSSFQEHYFQESESDVTRFLENTPFKRPSSMSLKKKEVLKQEKIEKSSTADTFDDFIISQLKESRPYKKRYLITKHQIQNILMEAQLKKV